MLCYAYTGGLSHQAHSRPGLPHRAIASWYFEAASVHGRTWECLYAVSQKCVTLL